MCIFTTYTVNSNVMNSAYLMLSSRDVNGVYGLQSRAVALSCHFQGRLYVGFQLGALTFVRSILCGVSSSHEMLQAAC